MSDIYDLVVIGAGSGGVTAAEFAASIGAKVALVEKHRIGGDCTWTGCVPSKALIKASRVAHTTRTASTYGIMAKPPSADMVRVRNYVRGVIRQVHQHETPEKLAAEGIEVIMGAARFIDAHTVRAGEHTLHSKNFLITTGAHPIIPPIPGLNAVDYLTHAQLFELAVLPAHLIIIGAGPIGAEMAQAWQRLGAQVTLIDVQLLPHDEPEVHDVISRVFIREGIRCEVGLATAVRQAGAEVVVNIDEREFRGDQLLIAVGRAPNVDGLGLENAGVTFSPKGIPVNQHLRTNVSHIFAAGDCTGGLQFTHVAGYQAYVAARNALLPSNESVSSHHTPWTTFTDPEVAHVGLTEAQAREQFGSAVRVRHHDIERIDRAVCEQDTEGFIKVVEKQDGTLLGATVVSGRAGEVITEFTLALKNNMQFGDLAEAMHVYPTYATSVQQMAGDAALDNFLGSTLGKIVMRFSGLGRQRVGAAVSPKPHAGS